MHEGDVSHEEVNAAIAAAEKTIVFGRQTRVKDGLVMDDEKLPRFYIGHDQVKFFYSAVRQLPEYFLDALLARNISVTLLVGRGLCCFKDVRNHQAIHLGRTRRTIYLPEKILEVAFNNGYDYWSLTRILIVEGWKLLDYILLYDLIRTAKKVMARRRVQILGYSAVRRIVLHRNKHRSSFESPAMIQKKKESGLDVAINELEEFIGEYEPSLLRAMRFGGDGRLGAMLEKPFRDLEPDPIAKALYNEYQQELWAARKADELADEQGFPDRFLLDRDVIHPAAYEMAEAEGMVTQPQNMDEARHDYNDALRFDQLPEQATEALCRQAAVFGPSGIEGLVEEFVAHIFVDGKYNAPLQDQARRELGQMSSRRKNVYVFLESGTEFLRFREVMKFYVDVRAKRRKLELEDVEFIRVILIAMAAAKSAAYDMTNLELITSIVKVDELFEQFGALLVGEAGRLLDRKVTRPEIDALETWLNERDGQWTGEARGLAGEIGDALEVAIVRTALCLDLSANYQQMVRDLVARSPKAESIIEEFLTDAAAMEEEDLDPQAVEQQGVMIAARRALEAAKVARGEKVELAGQEHEDAELLVNMVQRVDAIIEILPEKPHAVTSGSMTSLRKVTKEFEDIKRRFPADPDQLGLLAMMLIRYDQSAQYETYLAHVRWMEKYALGERIERGGRVWYTPGLLRVIDEERPGSGPIAETAAALVEELADEQAVKSLAAIK